MDNFLSITQMNQVALSKIFCDVLNHVAQPSIKLY